MIGLGLDLDDLSKRALEIIKKCQKVYLESYTVKLPYPQPALEKILKKKIIELARSEVEKEDFIDNAKTEDIALLVYGSPLTATTHISLILKCKKEKIPYQVIHNASIFDAVAETGLQIYKFGKIASMPLWKESYKPTSFIEAIQENQSIGAHTLILIDIGLDYQNALQQLKEAMKEMKLEKIIVCSMLGTKKPKILYNTLDNLQKNKTKVEEPFCFIIPGKLHFLEEEMLKGYS